MALWLCSGRASHGINAVAPLLDDANGTGMFKLSCGELCNSVYTTLLAFIDRTHYCLPDITLIGVVALLGGISITQTPHHIPPSPRHQILAALNHSSR
jgi:hypothetical protein